MITGYMKNASPCSHWEWGGEYAKHFGDLPPPNGDHKKSMVDSGSFNLAKF